MMRGFSPARWTAAAAFAAVLGVGTAQAFAQPRVARETAFACTNNGYCSWWCVKQGYDGGACVNGECLCLYAEP